MHILIILKIITIPTSTTDTSLQTTFHILDTLHKDNTSQNTKDNKTTHVQNTKHDKKKQKKNDETTNNYNSYIQSQHANRSLQNNIPHSKYTPKIQIHPLQNNIHVSKVHCGSAFEPGASGLPYYCTSICARSCCTWRASSQDHTRCTHLHFNA